MPERSDGASPRDSSFSLVTASVNPQSIMTRVVPLSTTSPLPELPLPSEVKRIYLSWSYSSARILRPVEDDSGAPFESCTSTCEAAAPASLTWMRYCGCDDFGAGFQNLSLSTKPSLSAG